MNDKIKEPKTQPDTVRPRMPLKHELGWWALALISFGWLFFLFPSLLSYPDSFVNIGAVVVMVLYWVMMWHILFRKWWDLFVTKLKEEMK